jgi:hypothetical protein
MLILISINLLKGTKGGAPQVHKEQYKWLSTTATKKKKKRRKKKKKKKKKIYITNQVLRLSPSMNKMFWTLHFLHLLAMETRKILHRYVTTRK